jgi:hypothetical protein
MELGAAIPATSSDATARYSFFLDITERGVFILPSIFLVIGFSYGCALRVPESPQIVGKTQLNEKAYLAVLPKKHNARSVFGQPSHPLQASRQRAAVMLFW